MTGIMNREFAELAQNGLNYLTWASDVEIVLEGKEIKGALSAGTPMAPSTTTPAQNAQALHFLRHHMCGTLKNEYMAERSASALWAALKARFSRLKYTVQPQAEAEWMRLRFADFKTVGEYNSALHRICTSLLLCGTTITDKEKIEKTLSTFHPTAIQSSRNYRQEKFQQYAALIDALQVDEAQDEVIKKNFSSQPFAGGPSQEVNAGAYKAGKGEARPQDCFRCGSKTHFSRQCRAPKHVVDAYKAKKARETHLLQVEAPPAPAAAPVMIPVPNGAPGMAQVEAPEAALQVVPVNAEVPMEVEHVVPPPVPQLDIDAAAAMIANDEKLTEMEISAEVDGFLADSI
ncbi:hypothetical protein QYE76_015809 [Lolium multiflorum]|uniref:CCHC-type domain-containing protein n=1 Tax=Lolium multiflorum TaxID=4521 RepID=A0AAD8U5I8_LOLMU|nr:hypothetical protein QYE76_015809 [Lolium multiflorum]